MAEIIHLSNNRKDPLWEDFLAGDRQAFSRIFQHHYSYLYHYGLKLGADPDLAKDSIQELFIHLWENRHRLAHTTSIKFYLMKCYRRQIGKLLGQKRRQGFQSNPDEQYDFELVFSAEQELITEEASRARLAHLQTAFNSLSKRQREVIYLKFYAQLNYEQIGEVMGLQYQSVRNYLHQALVALRRDKALLGSLSCLLALALLSWLA
jgi:RNA polymerase sigma factor (sigma-70 family)